MGTALSILLPTREATQQLGELLGKLLPPGSVLLLAGPLGGGKTCFTQGLGRGLGVRETIDSPTFTLINEYLSGRLPLYHVDLYRLDQAAAAALYLEIYWEGEEREPGILVVEWPDRLQPLPEHPICLTLNYADEGRHVRLEWPGGWQDPLWVELKKYIEHDELLANEV